MVSSFRHARARLPISSKSNVNRPESRVKRRVLARKKRNPASLSRLQAEILDEGVIAPYSIILPAWDGAAPRWGRSLILVTAGRWRPSSKGRRAPTFAGRMCITCSVPSAWSFRKGEVRGCACTSRGSGWCFTSRTRGPRWCEAPSRTFEISCRQLG
jgi:hypothetical protein